MADVNQTIVEPTKVTDPKPYGQRNDTSLAAAYPESPIHAAELSDAERKKAYTDLLTAPASEGLGVNSFDPDYSRNGAPNVAEIDEVNSNNGGKLPVGQGAGAPTTPYVPPLTSPGVGNFTADDQGPWTGPAPVKGTEYGSGLSSDAVPSVTSAEIEDLTIGQALEMGRSFAGSDGKGS